MAKAIDKDKKLVLGVVWNCATELKILLTALLIVAAFATLFQVIPSPFTVTASDLRLCISKISSPIPEVALSLTSPPSDQQHISVPSPSEQQPIMAPSPPPPPPPPPPFVETEQILDNGILKRAFNGYGSAAFNFITMGAYRGGLNTFAVVGLSSKPLHVYAKPIYKCEWIPNSDPNSSVSVAGNKFLTDWGYGRVYTVIVVNCTFEEQINGDNLGGRLILHASSAGGGDARFNLTDKFDVLEEKQGSLDTSIFESKPKYDYFYCGSSLYGDLSPQRVREWLAYHVRLFGPKSHFVFHDAGGVHEEVMEVLKPWIELGYVTLQDIRDQERFDGYYHNQFMVVNDCLHRYKFMAKWMFFFDVDEYIFIPPKNTLKSVLDSLSEYSQFTIEQMPMNSKFCLIGDYHKTHRKWGFEKLVYKDDKRGIRRDRKYAVQPRTVFATGVHMSADIDGKTTHKTESRIRYYHYHGTIAQRREPCQKYLNATSLDFQKTPYVLDTTLRDIGGAVKKFELKMIGPRLQNTLQ